MRNADKLDWADRDCSADASVDEDGVQVTSGLDRRGRELPDPVPMAPPVGMSQGPSLVDTVRRLFQQEAFRARLAAEGFDSPEEADDFDIDDDPLDPLTEYEEHFLPVEEPPAGEGASPVDSSPGAAGGGGGTSPPTPEPDKASVPPLPKDAKSA